MEKVTQRKKAPVDDLYFRASEKYGRVLDGFGRLEEAGEARWKGLEGLMARAKEIELEMQWVFTTDFAGGPVGAPPHFSDEKRAIVERVLARWKGVVPRSSEGVQRMQELTEELRAINATVRRGSSTRMPSRGAATKHA
jgi:hypothetical protein